MLYKKKIKAEVSTAASQKSKDFYIKCFEANPHAMWVFGIDGLPEESHKYRINQDGQKLFDIMIESKKHLENTPTWQYIVFSYNEDHIEQAKKLAKENGVQFMLLHSSRWLGNDDPLKPKKKGLSFNAL